MKAWFLNLSLSRKQLLVLVCAGLIPTVLVSILSFIMAKSQIQGQAFNQLESVRQIKSGSITRYFQQVESQIVTLANSRGTVEAVNAMAQSFPKVAYSENLGQGDIKEIRAELDSFYKQQFGVEFSERNEGEKVNVAPLHAELSDSAAALQSMYISSNENILGEKHLLDMFFGESSYHVNHALHHPTFRQYLERFGFYDIFLVDANTGDIVYSVYKELDYATSLKSGPYKDTGFARAYSKALKLKAGEVTVQDFETYLPSYNAPASFMATPIVEAGETVGVLVFQIPLEPINNIMTERAGMGESGETYLIGSDGLMRSDSFLDPVSHSVVASFKHPEIGRVDTDAARWGIEGKTGSSVITDYNGNPVLSSYAPLKVLGFDWVILAEIDVSEAFSGVYSLAYTAVFVCITVLVLLVFSALYISRLITQPIITLSRSIQEVQQRGDFKFRVNINQKDEVGQTCQSFNMLLENLASAFSSVTHVLDELGQGRCGVQIENRYNGDLAQLTVGVNNAASQIQQAKNDQERQSQLALESADKAEALAHEAQKQATETLIIKEALDVCDTSVMIADENFNIIYLNHAVKKLMGDVEPEVKQQIPIFSANALMGQNIDVFHKTPSHQRQLLAGLTETHKTNLAISTRDFMLTASPIRDEQNTFLGTVIEWQDLTEQLAKEREEKRVADQNARISQALDNSSTGTMIADKDQKIIYANDSMMNLMVNAQADVRSVIPSFDSRKVIGANINMFREKSGQASNNIDAAVKMDFIAGSKNISITENPIRDTAGACIGTVVEWEDRTSEVAIEKEIDHIITSASKGDFSQKLDLEGKSGFFHKISSGLNEITGQTESALNDMVRVLGALSEGDLTQTIDRDYDGDFSRLKKSTNQTITKLRDITEEIKQSSSTIARASDEISVGNSDLSSRTEQQASSLEETASSMEEITQTVIQSEKNAEEATHLSESSTKIAQEGYSAVEETSEAMKDISESSNRIVSIISVIDEIAFQTNLLALNAAVEAARAGEQGRGFAVVAGEVRNLAQRSSSAAKEIKDLINDSQSKVGNGIELVQNSKETLNSIVQEIQKVSEIIAEVSTSAKEQSAGIEQVNVAVSQMDTMTQQNAALVEQASAASASMADQAQGLSRLISFFRQ